MKIIRSTTCSLKFATAKKREVLSKVLTEYGKIVNSYINLFWNLNLEKGDLLKPVIDKVNSPYSFRLKKVAAREAIDMIKSVRERWKDKPNKISKPKHSGNRIMCSSTLIELNKSNTSFDFYLKIRSIGFKIKLDIPIKSHKHFNELNSRGKILKSYILTRQSVQFCFEIETGPKKKEGKTLGIDSGIKCLVTTNDGQRIGDKIEFIINSINRCKHGSLRQKRLRKYLLHYIDFTAKEVFRKNKNLSRIIIERLKNLNFKTKVRRKIGKGLRKSVGSWNYRYWLSRIEMNCEDNCVSFTSINPSYTSQICNFCGHSDKTNRLEQDKFCCVSCGHTDHADVNAAKNILDRGVSLVYRRGK
jgi:IS605 OrfB family transposase